MARGLNSTGRNFMRPVRIALVSVALTLAAVTAASAQSRVRVGVLDCRGGTVVGMILGSTTTMSCVFNGSGRSEPYAARVNRLGLDIGVTRNVSMAWAVFAPTKRIGRGNLAGSYVGASANATVGIGGGANVLIGGSGNTIALQPLSLQGQTGLNLAVGVSGLQLTYGR
jgi:hypothetical protein